MVKRVVKKDHEKQREKKNLYMSLFILVIMVMSIGGFAIMSGGGFSSSSENKYPENVDLQQFEQNGQVFWAAIRNHEPFIFESIDGFENRTDLASLAEQIKTKEKIDLYVSQDFNSQESIYLLDKALMGMEINYEMINQTSCEENTLVLARNDTYSGNCMKFISQTPGIDAEILTYHLVK